MLVSFESVRNHHEEAVFQVVLDLSSRYPAMEFDANLLVDVACIALNRLPARYIRHPIDLIFYTTEVEQAKTDKAIHQAVIEAFEFMASRLGIKAAESA